VRKGKGITGGLFWVLLGIAISVASCSMKLGRFTNPGPGFLPLVSGICMILAGVVLTLQRTLHGNHGSGVGFRDEQEQDKVKAQAEGGPREPATQGHWGKFLIPSLTILALLVYVSVIEYLGFLLTTFLCLLFLFKLTDPGKWAKPILLSCCTALASYLLFGVWFKVPFPKGPFGF
jgi:putative tricarboxylic transport membrane protein